MAPTPPFPEANTGSANNMQSSFGLMEQCIFLKARLRQVRIYLSMYLIDWWAGSLEADDDDVVVFIQTRGNIRSLMGNGATVL